MKILFCDDDYSLTRVVRMTLEMCGHEVQTASSAHDAIILFDLMKVTGQVYDIVITDQEMQGGSGFYLCGHVRSNGYTGRLVLFTGWPKEDDNVAAVGAEFWAKPMDISEIVRRVDPNC